jgi:hypothetical protein
MTKVVLPTRALEGTTARGLPRTRRGVDGARVSSPSTGSRSSSRQDRLHDSRLRKPTLGTRSAASTNATRTGDHRGSFRRRAQKGPFEPMKQWLAMRKRASPSSRGSASDPAASLVSRYRREDQVVVSRSRSDERSTESVPRQAVIPAGSRSPARHRRVSCLITSYLTPETRSVGHRGYFRSV